MDEEKRNDFYTVWAGEKAIESIAFLGNFLSEERKDLQDTGQLKSEHERISKLLNNELSEAVESRLKIILSSGNAVTT